MKATTDTTFRLFGLGARRTGHILIDQSITVQPDADAHDKDTPRESWGIKSGLDTPRQLVEALRCCWTWSCAQREPSADAGRWAGSFHLVQYLPAKANP
jgi:hypothetical protein